LRSAFARQCADFFGPFVSAASLLVFLAVIGGAVLLLVLLAAR
jgi:hypothetical protein